MYCTNQRVLCSWAMVKAGIGQVGKELRDEAQYHTHPLAYSQTPRDGAGMVEALLAVRSEARF